MGRDDWFRNEIWDADIEAAFRAKLARARSAKPQYLRIQAGYLTKNFPDASLLLIDEFFALGDHFEFSIARCVQARAFEVQGRIGEAIDAYKLALQWDADHPRFISTARWDYPELVASHRIASEYQNAMDVLTLRFEASDHVFPKHRYIWNGSMALILHDRGEGSEARNFAQRALRAAMETQSPFRNHRNLGLVSDTSDEFGIRIKRIAEPSAIRRLFRLKRF